MKDKRHKLSDKKSELKKYRDLVIATIDYYVDNQLMNIKTADFDSNVHFKFLKQLTEEHFDKGRLARLKQFFRDMTESQIESIDLKLNEYLRKKTNYDIDIFKSYFERVERIILKGRITTDNQFYDLKVLVDQLSQSEPIDKNKIEIIDKIMADYEQKKR